MNTDAKILMANHAIEAVDGCEQSVNRLVEESARAIDRRDTDGLSTAQVADASARAAVAAALAIIDCAEAAGVLTAGAVADLRAQTQRAHATALEADANLRRIQGYTDAALDRFREIMFPVDATVAADADSATPEELQAAAEIIDGANSTAAGTEL